MEMKLPEHFLEDFLIECDEHADAAIASLLSIEKGNSNPELLNEIYRNVHTIKGGAQLMGFEKLGRLAHILESCMDPIRKGRALFSADALNVILAGMDLLGVIRENIKQTRAEGPVGELIDDYSRRLAPIAEALLGKQIGDQPTIENSRHEPTLPLDFGPDGILFIEEPDAPPKSEKSESQNFSTATKTLGRSEKTHESVCCKTSNSVVKVSVDLLDKIIALIGELVLVRNQFSEKISHTHDDGLHKIGQRLNALTGLIQTEVMRTRMQPISNITSKYNKIVRDLAQSQGKQIDFSVDGGDTELDKSLIEALSDPLLHIIRNSADHGLELPEKRVAANKRPQGTIKIKALQEAGHVIIEVSDDGRGLNRAKILHKAIVQGLMGETIANSLSEEEVHSLIFLPGFSTAEKVSDISGRGVGMDVVKTNVEKIGGSIAITSKENLGMTIRIKVPLTLAIVPTLLVRASNCTFAIPQLKVAELICVDKLNTSALPIEDIADRPLYRLRGELLPLVSLSHLLGLGEPLTWSTAAELSSLQFIVTGTTGHHVGLVVDEILDSTDIVVKPLNQFLERLKLFSGATVLGDGSVAIIIDSDALVRHWMALPDNKKQQETRVGQAEVIATTRAHIGGGQDFLLFKLPPDQIYALPSHFAHRLEEISRSDIQHVSKQPLIIYRDATMPIIDLGEVCASQSCFSTVQTPTDSSEKTLALVVVQWHGSLLGLVVDSIVDVLSHKGRIAQLPHETSNIQGTLILEENVVPVIDLLSLLNERFPTAQVSPNAEHPITKNSVMVVDDSNFYRRHVTQLLEHAGFYVSTADSGFDCLEQLRSGSGKGVSLIVSDIEMPGMSGIDLAREIRSDESLRHLKVIALSTRNDSTTVDSSLLAGFDLYLEKLNPKILLESVKKLVENPK